MWCLLSTMSVLYPKTNLFTLITNRPKAKFIEILTGRNTLRDCRKKVSITSVLYVTVNYFNVWMHKTCFHESFSLPNTVLIKLSHVNNSRVKQVLKAFEAQLIWHWIKERLKRENIGVDIRKWCITYRTSIRAPSCYEWTCRSVKLSDIC